MPVDYKSLLQQEIAKGLPGEAAHLPMLPLNRPLSSVALLDQKDYRFSAVACILYQDDQGLKIILIERPTYDGAHSGQVAFPGGKMEKDDVTDEFTARRECFEEIGIQLKDVHYIGKLTDVFIPISGFIMHPHLYYLDVLPTMIPDAREVEQILTLNVRDFQSQAFRERRDLPTQQGFILKNVPGFHLNEHFIWGATALVLNELCELLKRVS